MLDRDCPIASQPYASMLGNDGVEAKTEALEDLLYDQDQYVKVRKWKTVGTCTSDCNNGQQERGRVIPCCHAPQTDVMPLKKALRQMKVRGFSTVLFIGWPVKEVYKMGLKESKYTENEGKALSIGYALPCPYLRQYVLMYRMYGSHKYGRQATFQWTH